MTQATKLTVMICDDETMLCDLIAEEIEVLGYNTLRAYSGNSAFALLQTNDVAAVISDIRMPDGDGIELLQKIRKAHKTKPVVILLSGFSDLSEERAYEEGADAVLAKPISLDELGEVLKLKLTSIAERLKRVNERFDVDLKATFAVENLETAQEASLINIGNGGCFISTQGPMPNIGESVKFELSFENEKSETFRGTGICRWRRSEGAEANLRGFGMEFTSLDDGSLKVYLEHLNS